MSEVTAVRAVQRRSGTRGRRQRTPPHGLCGGADRSRTAGLTRLLGRNRGTAPPDCRAPARGLATCPSPLPDPHPHPSASLPPPSVAGRPPPVPLHRPTAAAAAPHAAATPCCGHPLPRPPPTAATPCRSHPLPAGGGCCLRAADAAARGSVGGSGGGTPRCGGHWRGHQRVPAVSWPTSFPCRQPSLLPLALHRMGVPPPPPRGAMAPHPPSPSPAPAPPPAPAPVAAALPRHWRCGAT